jgi:Tol biopolymer transport system component
MRRPARAAAAVLLAASLTACERVSVNSSEEQANGETLAVSINRDGNLVAFQSAATNLAAGDNADHDVFVRDRAAGETALVSRSRESIASGTPEVAANGRRVAFISSSETLVPEDTNQRADVFLWERESGAIERVSVSSSEAQSTGSVASGPGPSGGLAVNRNGRYVVFGSTAEDLVAGDDNDLQDLFVRDRVAGTTVRIPAESVEEPEVEPDGSRLFGIGDPAISLDGRHVAFASLRYHQVPAGQLLRATADLYVHDLETGNTTRLSEGAGYGEAAYGVALDADGTHAAFSWSFGDLIVVSPSSGATTRLPAGATGEAGAEGLREPSLSRTGRFAAFVTDNGGLRGANVYVHDFQTGQTRRMTNNPEADFQQGFSFEPRISADGRYVAWVSQNDNLVANDTNGVADAFVAPVPR